MKTIAVATLGCKTNQYETEVILNQFIESDFSLVDFSQSADIYLINTCCVTNRAEYKSRNLVRKAIRNRKPNSKIIVTGCYVENNLDFFKKFDGELFTFSNIQKCQIFDCIANKSESQKEKNLSKKFLELTTDKFNIHTRVPIKIQDGCDFFCSYCILPFIRGKPKSRKTENIIKQVKKLAKNGVNEIVLTGINLGLYGKDFNNYSLLELVKDLSSQTDIKRIRLSSIEPNLFTDELIDELSKNEKICPHFHIPLQSGSDKVLKKMNRCYSSRNFRETVEKIKEKIPNAAIGCDVIVGFPGETDEEFEKTFSFIDNLDITYLHIFRYSPRPNTAAAKMKWKSNGVENKIRAKRLFSLNNEKKKRYFKYLIDNEISIQVVLEKMENGFWTSVSDHYVKIFLKNKNVKKGELKKVIAEKIFFQNEGISAKLISE
ncbi:MAG: tRNA (N(6)-L-threonylcarbamoyladenosine(37)-C(2))-methylthiotransferase MtaB [Candidatus Cloacimonetes bacterium]|nr:tRNA (N(6)-L-threonylcarbamoyladenosine(37)-C(2))-methylthiotransferase MtaB [Candidatus Cloacimonadota bacterium]